MSPDRFVTQTRFAELLSCSKAHVSNLKAAGRLVIGADGLVDVAASRERIRATAGAHERADAGGQGQGMADHAEREKKYKADLLEMEVAEKRRTLLRADDARATVVAAATSLRTRLEALPDQLAPRLAAINSEAEVRSLLAGEVEALLGELAHQFATLAGEGA